MALRSASHAILDPPIPPTWRLLIPESSDVTRKQPYTLQTEPPPGLSTGIRIVAKERANLAKGVRPRGARTALTCASDDVTVPLCEAKHTRTLTPPRRYSSAGQIHLARPDPEPTGVDRTVQVCWPDWRVMDSLIARPRRNFAHGTNCVCYVSIGIAMCVCGSQCRRNAFFRKSHLACHLLKHVTLIPDPP
ncbi:hypothetical protein Bbelb_122860 [Branchiostoma belcheri]|nr:hypothetical protein Bbelb_122860 [Branchiostoma belcheri]